MNYGRVKHRFLKNLKFILPENQLVTKKIIKIFDLSNNLCNFNNN